MAGQLEPSRDLRFGLRALESGVIDREELVSALGAWVRSPGRTLAEILARGGVLDAPTVARLEECVTRDLELLAGALRPDVTSELPASDASVRPGDPNRTGTFAFNDESILYCVLVGHDPFPDGDMRDVLGRVRRGIFPAPRRLRRSIDLALEAICLKAMSMDPKDRHATALDLANELETWLADVRYRDEHELALSQVKGSLARVCLERAHSRIFPRRNEHRGCV